MFKFMYLPRFGTRATQKFLATHTWTVRKHREDQNIESRTGPNMSSTCIKLTQQVAIITILATITRSVTSFEAIETSIAVTRVGTVTGPVHGPCE